MTDTNQERTRLVIISVLPDDAAEAVKAIRKPCCRRAGSREALSYPPHITLRTGVLVPPEKMEQFIGEFEALVHDVNPFDLKTSGILAGRLGGEYGNSPIACYEIAPSKALASLNARLNSYQPYRKSNRTAFHPHLSIAYGDLTEEGLVAIKRFLKEHPILPEREISWTCDNVSLYVKDGGQWVEFHRIPLKTKH
ncbi:MAG: 2'-5' RNA ligase family protein [Verrucomicrobiota bacterium]